MDIKTFISEDGNYSIANSKVRGYFSMPSKHFHDKYEIYYLRSGERYYFIKDRVFHIKKGHLVLIKEGELHKTTDAEKPDHERTLLYFRKPFVSTANNSTACLLESLNSRSYFVLELPLKEQQTVDKIFYEMFLEAEEQQAGFEVCLQGLLMKLLVYMGRYIRGTDENAFVSNSPKHEKVSEIVKYINGHYYEELSIPDMARLFYISPYYLSRIFKETTGFTLLEYINTLRIKEAQKLLTGKRIKVIDVADKTGFGSVSQFNRTFKQVSGFSPLNYRKLFKKSD
ncbi:MAG: hypothetical protein K0R50_3948 [Eubacterium sp.]|jgi:AraC-like DNA-binding protein|nr:hypothetical protein [Eubacterium sp.]